MHVGRPGRGLDGDDVQGVDGDVADTADAVGSRRGIVSAASWTRKDLHHTRVLPRRNSSVSPSRDAAPRWCRGSARPTERRTRPRRRKVRNGARRGVGGRRRRPTQGLRRGMRVETRRGRGRGPGGAARKARRGSRRRVTPRAPSRGARWTPRARKGTTPGASSGAPSATKQAPSRPDARARRAVGLWRSKHTPRRRVVRNDAAPPHRPRGNKLPNVFGLSDWPAHAGAFHGGDFICSARRPLDAQRLRTPRRRGAHAAHQDRRTVRMASTAATIVAPLARAPSLARALPRAAPARSRFLEGSSASAADP